MFPSRMLSLITTSLAIVFALAAFPAPVHSAIVSGLLSDFQDGTVQGWGGGAGPVNIPDGGPGGNGDSFLQIGNGGNLATHNTGDAFSGEVQAGLVVFFADMMRPAADLTSLEIRLHLLGPGTGNRWASTSSVTVPNDGQWRTYAFAFDEDSLTRVQGSGSYEDLLADVNRVMFRYDPGPPSAGGSPVDGTLGIDNVQVGPIPEPTAVSLLACLGVPLLLRRRRGLRPRRER